MDCALAVRWDIERDTIVLIVDDKKKQKTVKGMLSSIAIVYDPLGFASQLYYQLEESIKNCVY